MKQPIFTIGFGVYAGMLIHDEFINGSPFDATMLLIFLGIAEALVSVINGKISK